MRQIISLTELKSTSAGKRRDNQHLFDDKVKQKRQKYGNHKIEIDGHKFDSKREGRHYVYLRQLQTIGEIRDLKLQEVFQLSVCKYKADFTYYTKAGEYIVCDVKGFKTKDYIMKKKMMKSEKNIDILEVK